MPRAGVGASSVDGRREWYARSGMPSSLRSCSPRPRGRFTRLRGWWLLPSVVLACGPVVSRPSAEPPAPPPAPPELATAPAPAILSAHLTRIDDPELGGRDGLVVVFDAEVDASALQARAFVVMQADREPAAPEQATLAPASEDDENRTVLLVGELAAAGAEPTHVAVVGPLWAEDGRTMKGLGAPVEPFAAGPRVVMVEVLSAGPGRCEGAAQVLRTYWSDELRGVESEDLLRMRVAKTDGDPTRPVRFDDHADAHAEAGQDNVLDLCMNDAAAQRVSIQAGVFRGPAGHASAAVDASAE
jgi:hypothetical protein